MDIRASQRYRCPAYQHYNSSFEVGRAADPKGTMSCRLQKKSVCTSIRLSVHLFDQSRARLDEGRTDVQTDRWTDRQTDGCTHRFPMYSTGHHPLWVRCPKKGISLAFLGCCCFHLIDEKTAEREKRKWKSDDVCRNMKLLQSINSAKRKRNRSYSAKFFSFKSFGMF